MADNQRYYELFKLGGVFPLSQSDREGADTYFGGDQRGDWVQEHAARIAEHGPENVTPPR